MFYKSIDDLDKDIINNLYRFHREFDLVVGVPRSGMLVANIIALYLNLPLVDLQGFVEGRIFESGKTRRPGNYEDNIKNIRKVLIVEDSVDTGQSIAEVKSIIKEAGMDKRFEILYFAAYIRKDKVNNVDLYLDICDMPRVFEWNIMHHQVLENSFFDLDGVLCIDPREEDDDDGKIYVEFINNVQPLFIPTKKINTIVTCRLEKYRDATLLWLNKNNIKFNNLIMMDYPSKADRIREGKHAEYKAYHYRRSKAVLFIESNLSQAIYISKNSNKPVYCLENRKMIYPNVDIAIQNFGQPSYGKKMMKIRFWLAKAAKFIFPVSLINMIRYKKNDK